MKGSDLEPNAPNPTPRHLPAPRTSPLGPGSALLPWNRGARRRATNPLRLRPTSCLLSGLLRRRPAGQISPVPTGGSPCLPGWVSRPPRQTADPMAAPPPQGREGIACPGRGRKGWICSRWIWSGVGGFAIYLFLRKRKAPRLKRSRLMRDEMGSPGCLLSLSAP